MSRPRYLKPPPNDYEKIESGIESGPESPVPMQCNGGYYGLTHEQGCGCPAADLQAMVIAQV